MSLVDQKGQFVTIFTLIYTFCPCITAVTLDISVTVISRRVIYRLFILSGAVHSSSSFKNLEGELYDTIMAFCWSTDASEAKCWFPSDADLDLGPAEESAVAASAWKH